MEYSGAPPRAAGITESPHCFAVGGFLVPSLTEQSFARVLSGRHLPQQGLTALDGLARVSGMTTNQPAVEDHEVSNGEVRRARQRARVSQAAVAAELRISRPVYIDFEKERKGLPYALTPTDVLEAIEVIKARKAAEA